MYFLDRYENKLSTGSAQAADCYVTGVDHILAATFGAQSAFEAAVNTDPGFALGHIGLARAFMLGGDMAAARASLGRAQDLKAGLSEREQQHIGVFEHLLAGRAAETRAAVFAHVGEFPRDALIAQICTNVFGLIGFSGQVGREAELLAYTSRLLPHYGEDWWMMSMHALSLCETGQTAAAAALMDKSLDLNNANANGSHFKAHAQYEAGEAEAGLAYLSGWLTDYDPRAILHGHLSWHVALWSLHAGDTDRMWAMVDSAVAPGKALGLPLNILTDTASILYRAELAGVEVPQHRWREISDFASRLFPDSGQNFADLHSALSHAMAGEGDRLDHIISNPKGPAADLVAPVARAWGAISRQEWQQALQELTPVMAEHERLGGSRAQRDLLEFAYLNTLLKLGKSDEAERLVQMHRPVFHGQVPIRGAGAPNSESLV